MEFIDGFCRLGIDAVPQRVPRNINEDIHNQEIIIHCLLSDFTKEDYKSLFFLLMDFVKLENFLILTKGDENFLRDAFIQLYHKHLKDESLVELFGTLKRYKKLKILGTCYHIFESQEKKFNSISSFWKMLYSLCEELTDEDFENLKRDNPSNIEDQMLIAEDWFCWALQNKLFSRNNISNLKTLFSNYPKCLSIIESYKVEDHKDFESYEIRTPTALSPCGVALIFNFENFDEKSELDYRYNSNRDVHSLEKLWEEFGFEVNVYTDLTHTQTSDIIKEFSTKDYSSYDVFVCCIMSHGQSSSVYSSDGVLMSIPELFTPILNDCLTLNKKPKLFFIQACQGTNILQSFGRNIYQIQSAKTEVTKFSSYPVPPRMCDALLVNSSIQGFVSFRNDEGSWFIQSLCKQMMQYGDKSSIEETMIKVQEDVSKLSEDFGASGPREAIQIPSRYSTLQKKLILKKKIS